METLYPKKCIETLVSELCNMVVGIILSYIVNNSNCMYSCIFSKLNKIDKNSGGNNTHWLLTIIQDYKI